MKRKNVLQRFCKIQRKISLPESVFKVVSWKLETFRSSHWRCSVKQGVLKNFANFTGKNLCWNLFLIKLQFWWPTTLLKKTLTEMLSCKLCKLFKDSYFDENLWMSNSKLYFKRGSNIGVFLWILWIIQEDLFWRRSRDCWFWNTNTGVSLQ